MYCTIKDIRDEGFESCDFTDARVTDKILDAQDFIDLHTGRFFEPRSIIHKESWKGSKDVLLQMPIIDITDLRFVFTDLTLGDPFADTSFILKNRHVREGLLDPDDREDPLIQLLFVRPNLVTPRVDPDTLQEILQTRVQNIQLTGVFGFTDPVITGGRAIASDAGDAITAPDLITMVNGNFSVANGDLGREITVAGAATSTNDGIKTIIEVLSKTQVRTRETLTTDPTGFTASLATFPQWGVTPRQIRKACMLLAIRDLDPLNSADPVDAALSAGRVRRMKVRDQEIEFTADARVDRGAAITGDPKIDVILSTFRRPMKIGAA